ncbi:MAG: hypothetical protein HWD61_05045 [Parachlamydiaceae bacterium]|nr:MAG: hypothetical protein HWD61_05045 [Parachlamydiaceae bacterium]
MNPLQFNPYVKNGQFYTSENAPVVPALATNSENVEQASSNEIFTSREPLFTNLHRPPHLVSLEPIASSKENAEPLALFIYSCEESIQGVINSLRKKYPHGFFYRRQRSEFYRTKYQSTDFSLLHTEI